MFFSFWLSRVPKEAWQSFWEKIERALAPGGRAYLVDNARSDRASARDHDPQDREEEVMLRRLADRREYHIVKHWFDAAGLGSGLAGVGWNALIRRPRSSSYTGKPRQLASHSARREIGP